MHCSHGGAKTPQWLSTEQADWKCLDGKTRPADEDDVRRHDARPHWHDHWASRRLRAFCLVAIDTMGGSLRPVQPCFTPSVWLLLPESTSWRC